MSYIRTSFRHPLAPTNKLGFTRKDYEGALQHYQAAGEGFTAWIDDIALCKERIGLRGLPRVRKR